MRLVAVTFDAQDPAGLAAFWGGLLGRSVVDETRGLLLPGERSARSAKHGRDRQRFDLAADDLVAEVARLVALGATRLGDRDGGVEPADPDGNEFWVAPG